MGNALGVGREAPSFNLTTTDGDEITLSQFRGDWYPVLVFVPADAVSRLVPLDAAAGRFWGLRGQILAICERQADGALPAEPPGVSLPILMDDGSVAHAYGAARAGAHSRPMTHIVDRAGKIVWTAEGDDALDPAVIATAFYEVVR